MRFLIEFGPALLSVFMLCQSAHVNELSPKGSGSSPRRDSSVNERFWGARIAGSSLSDWYAWSLNLLEPSAEEDEFSIVSKEEACVVLAFGLLELFNQQTFRSLESGSDQPAHSSFQPDSSSNHPPVALESKMEEEMMTTPSSAAFGFKQRVWSVAMEFFKEMPRKIYHTIDEGTVNKSVCSKCGLLFKNGQKIVELPCQHSYHESCMEQHVFRTLSVSCPLLCSDDSQ